MAASTFFKLFKYALVCEGIVAGIRISHDIFAIDVLTALKSSLEQGRKHVLRLLGLQGDQALRTGFNPILPGLLNTLRTWGVFTPLLIRLFLP